MTVLTLVTVISESRADEGLGLALPVRPPVAAVPALLDDAGLNDLQVLGETQAWAVGDRGVIWHSADGGRHWTLVPSTVACPLRSVCFLTHRVGWIAGGSVGRRESYGVLLYTTDGGKSWEQRGGHQLPLLYDMRFFDLDHGVAVGEANSRFPTGVLTTSDGGQSWQAVDGPAGDGWKCGSFLEPSAGFVGGRLGQYASVSGGQLRPGLAGASGLRGIVDVTIHADHRGWFVGDGGLALRTETGGVSWRQPSGEFSREVRDVMDFRAVAIAGTSVWLAGQPGSVVWHSDDDGAIWTAQPTGSPLPLAAVDFSSPTHGLAVGAMGRIIRTTDGGTTWEAVRGGHHRAALLAVHAHEDRVSLNLTTKYGHELGYRMVSSVIARRDIGPDSDDGRTLDVRLHEAMTAAGGAGGSVDWAFPIAAPGLERNQTELVREWELLTDKRLREKMLGRLVALFCTWRPDVVIVDEQDEDDAATKLLADAVLLAIRQSTDPTQYADVRQNLHLPLWQVQRLFHRLPRGRTSSVQLATHEFLPRLGKSISMAAAEPYRMLNPSNMTFGEEEAFVTVHISGTAEDTASNARDLFTGLSLRPGGDARRRLMPIDEKDFDRLQNLAQQQRNYAAYASRMLDDPRHAAQLVGQTKDLVAGAPPEQAAEQLFQLADEYRLRGEWEHAQAVLVELAERYPHEPPAVEAMSWLLAFWSSAEVGWQRLKESSSVQQTRESTDGTIVQANLRRAIERSRARLAGGDDTIPSEPTRSPIQQSSVGGELRVGGVLEQHTVRRQAWLSSADRLAKSLKKLAPAEFESPARQFQTAALERKQNHPRQADEIYRSFLNATANGPWNRIAAGELWITQPSAVPARPIVVCRRAASPPFLDGALDEACWAQDSEVVLRSEAEHRQPSRPFVDPQGETVRATVKWAYDAGFLYVGARVPREAALPSDRPELPGRTDDADLTRHDRLVFAIDTDRDYATFYRIEVDQRGWTADACWENRAWNCQRFIAAEADDREWRIEMAIPFEEFVPSTPVPGETWAAGISRVMPTIGVESWTHPGGSDPRPEGFGLLRFE